MPLLRKGADGKPRAIIKDGDACFFYNFRADRARQLTLALHAGDADFPYFDRGQRPKLAAFATMTQYDAKVDVPVAFPPQSLAMILGEVLSKHGVSQLRTAETEKYAHVTYFFNGGAEPAVPGRGAAARPVEPRRGDLRPRARDVGGAGHRRRGRGAQAGRADVHPRQLRQPRHGRPHRQARARHQRRSRRSTRAMGRIVEAARRRSTRRCSSPPITATARR